MTLTRQAAVEVCSQAFSHGLAVACVEGGIWHDPGFEPRVDCIWDGMHRPMNSKEADQNNAEAQRFIELSPSIHDAFLITTWTYSDG